MSWVGPIERPDGTTARVVISSQPQRLMDGSTEWVGMVAPLVREQDRAVHPSPRDSARTYDVLGMVGHDFAGPLTAIRTYVELATEVLLDTPRSPASVHSAAELRRYLEVIARQSRRLDVMRRDLLTLSSSESGVLSASFETTLVRPHLVAACELVRPPLTVTVHCPDELSCVVQPSRLAQIVDNLVSNAARYADRRIALGAVQTGRSVRITVSDDGPGVAPDVVDRLFTAFAHSDLERRPDRAGSGLGLHIVRTLTAVAGGEVFHRASDETTAFIVVLPAAKSSTDVDQ